jgi:iron complex outermembrane receptor protein
MGIVSISTYERMNNGFGGSIRTQIGDGGLKHIELANEGKINNFSYNIVANWLDCAGKIAAKNNIYELDNFNSSLIPNSFSEQKNIYGKTIFRPSKTLAIGASANYIKYSKGVIPEQHRGNSARFWRYNDNERLLLTLNSNIFTDYKNRNTIKFTYWFDNFIQNIDQFTNLNYNIKNATEASKNNTHGIRIIDVYNFSDKNNITFAANTLLTVHNEQIETYENSTVTEHANNEYSQNTFSFTVEYNHILWDLFSFKFGTEFNYWETPKTGVFTEAEGRNDNTFGVIAGVNYSLTKNNILFFNFSRKSRFPSLRESYSAALGKFKVNPNLSPEKNLFFETGY